MRGALALWLVHWTPDPAAHVQVLTGAIMLCSWARNFTLTPPVLGSSGRIASSAPYYTDLVHRVSTDVDISLNLATHLS